MIQLIKGVILLILFTIIAFIIGKLVSKLKTWMVNNRYDNRSTCIELDEQQYYGYTMVSYFD